MKVGLIILARLSSSRLPGKFLMKIQGKPLAQHITERLQTEFSKEQIYIATSDCESDDAIAEFCETNKISCFRGDLDNVAKRFLECAETHSLDVAVRVCGDNFFVNTSLIKLGVDHIKSGKADLFSNSPDRTFPHGMTTEVVNMESYKKAYTCFNEPDNFEHVTHYFYVNEDNFNNHYVRNEEFPQASRLRLAIDTQEDFNLAERIYEVLDSNYLKCGLPEILKVLEKLNIPLSSITAK